MEELWMYIAKVLNSEYVQAAIAAKDILGFVADVYKKINENEKTLEREAVYCFDCALCSFCEYYNKEYDSDAIWQTLSTSMESMQSMNSKAYQDKVLKQALGTEELSNEERKRWRYIVNKTIAEKGLSILSDFLSLSASQEREEIAPRVYTELAPRPPVEEQMVSRSKEQEEILKLIEQSKKLVLVNGLGGIGKSTVCKELFYYLQRHTDKRLAWVTYNGVSLKEDFINQFFYPERLRERKERMGYFLQNDIEPDTILFVDNLNARDVEEPFIQVLERARCSVVCTSRITDFRHFVTIPIHFFKEEECILLFKKYAEIPEDRKEYDECIRQIVSKVGRHTLTIEILGKISLAEEQSPAEVLQLLEREGIELDGIVEVDLKEDTLVGHLCKIFSTKTLAKEQKYILAHFANCPIEQIPKKIKKWLGLSNKHHINYLKKYGWFVENTDTYYMHPIIKEVVKRLCALEPTDYQILLENLEKITHYSRKIGVSETLSLFPYVEAVLKQIEGMINPTVASLYFNMAVMQEETKKFSQAIETFQKALALWEAPEMTVYKEKRYINTRRANVMNQIGACFYYLDDVRQARAWYDKVGQLFDMYDDKELTFQLYNNYALTYQKEYRLAVEKGKTVKEVQFLLKKAIAYYERTIAGFRRMGKRDEFMAIAFRNVGSVYMEFGDYQASLRYNMKALEIRESCSLPADSPNRERNYYDLACCFQGLATQQTSVLEKIVKYKFACYYYGKSHKICSINTRRNTNQVSLEKLEDKMDECKGNINSLLLFRG